MTAVDDAVLAIADEPARRAHAGRRGGRALSDWIRDHVVYEPGTTERVDHRGRGPRSAGGASARTSRTSALAVLRAAGHPGPLRVGLPLSRHREALIDETYAGQSHAWLEAWVGDWHPLDPTSGAAVGERHVVVARGRDYADVVPLKGVYNGGPSVSLDVSVELTRGRVQPKRLARTRSMRQNVCRMTAHHSILVVT